MNKLFTKIATAVVGFAMAIGVGAAVGSNKEVARVDAATTKSISSFSSTSGSIDTNITYACYKGDGTTDPVYDQNYLRVYKPASGKTTGGYISVTAATGYKISSVSFTGSGDKATSVATKVDSGAISSSESFAKSDTKTVSGVTATTVSLYNVGTERLSIGTISVTYDSAVTSYSFTKNGTNCAIVGPDTGSTAANASFTITPDAGYNAPASVSLTRGGAALSSGYSYSVSKNVGSLTINAASITAAITISATAQPIVPTEMTIASTVSTLTSSGGNYVVNLSTGDKTAGALANCYDEDLTATLTPNDALDKTVTWSKTDASSLIDEDTWINDDDELMFSFSTENEGSFVITATANSGTVVKTVTYNITQKYTITTTVSNGSYSGDSYIHKGGSATVTISADTGYKLPADVSVSGASYTFESGAIHLSNPTSDVEIDVECPELSNFSIVVNETNGTHTGATSIQENGNATLTFTPTSGWGQPNDVTVSGAQKSWNSSTGVLTLSNPTATVNVTYSAKENKLDSISLNKTSGSYTLGDPLDDTIVVTAHYTVANDATVTPTSVTGYNPYAIGAQTVEFSYTEGGVTKTANYTATVSSKTVGPATTYYEKVTSMSGIENGGTYLIVGYEEAHTQYYGMPAYSSGNNIKGVTVTLTESNTRITPANMSTTAEYTLTSTGTSNQYYIGDGTNYLYAAGTGNSNHLKAKSTTDSSAGAFTISCSDGVFSVVAASSNRNTMRFNATNVNSTTKELEPLFACYADNTTQTDVMFFKKTVIEATTASLIRIVCDSSIDETTGYKGGEKYVGDKIYTSDFVVKKQMDTGTSLEAITGFTINGGSEVALSGTSNTITISYTEGGVTKTASVVVSASERQAELSSVTLSVGESAKLDGYIAYSGAEWNLTDIKVVYDWTVDEFDDEVDLQDLVNIGEATLDPAVPTTGATSFTVSYEYLDVEIENATVTLEEAVISDYVSSVSWGGKSLAHFKSFSGGQLTADTVNQWTVKATYAGAGESDALSFGTGANQFTIIIGSKVVNSLPYTWVTEDDGQYIAVVVGGVAKEDHTHAVANICAIINEISHEEPATEERTISNMMTNAIYSAEGTSSTGGDFTFTDENGYVQFHSDKGYKYSTSRFNVYAGGTYEITSSYNIKTITFTVSSGYEGGLTSGTAITVNKTSWSSSNGTSKQARITGIAVVIDFEGTETTVYTNLASHFDAQKAVVKFAKAFNAAMDATSNCTTNMSTAWANVELAYDNPDYATNKKPTGFLQDIAGLSEDEQNWAKNMLKYVDAHYSDNSELACVERAMETYDRCVRNHKMTAFMSTIRPVSSARVTPMLNISGNNNIAAVIVILSMISIAAVGGYFFLRKRKED